MEKSGYYAVIPAPVRYDETIPDGAKLLFGEISALCNEKGFCWASNAYFAELYKKSADTISRWVSCLEKAGYIICEVEKNAGNARKIYIASDGTLSAKMPIGYRQKRLYPIGKNADENNTFNIKEEAELLLADDLCRERALRQFGFDAQEMAKELEAFILKIASEEPMPEKTLTRRVFRMRFFSWLSRRQNAPKNQKIDEKSYGENQIF